MTIYSAPSLEYFKSIQPSIYRTLSDNFPAGQILGVHDWPLKARVIIVTILQKKNFKIYIIYEVDYRPHSLVKHGDNAIGSICPSVCVFVCLQK